MKSRTRTLVFFGLSVAILQVTAGCAPTLVGLPDHRGLIVFEGEVVDAWGVGHNIQNVVLIRRDSQSEYTSAPERWKKFGDYLIFDNLQPGSYWIKRVESTLYGGEFNVSVSFPKESIIPVLAGEPVYIGKIVVKVNSHIESSEIDQNPAHAVRAWTTLAKEYNSTLWASAFQKRLGELAGHSPAAIRKRAVTD